MNWSERYKKQLDSLQTTDNFKDELVNLPKQAKTNTNQQTIKKTGNVSFFTKLKRDWKPLALAGVACIAIGMFATDAINFNMGSDFYSNITSLDYTSDAAYPEMTTEGSYDMDDGVSYDMEESEIDYATSDSAGTGMENNALTTENTRSTDANTQKKIIYTASMDIETTTYSETLAALEKAIAEVGGYTEYSEAYNHNDEHHTYIQYRVPAENYNNFLELANGAGIVTYKTESSQDVTSEYIDINARIETLSAQHDRLLALQAAAENLTDLLEIESKISEVQYQLENYQGQMNYLVDQVDYCTVNVGVYEVIEYTPQPPETLIEKISRAFFDGIENFGYSLANLLIWLISNLIWFAVIAVVILITLRVIKKRKNKNAE